VEGIREVLEPMVLERRRARITEVLSHRLDAVSVLLDAPHDPHNGAAVIRSADAFGVQSVHVIERVEPFLVEGTVALGTERWVDVFTYPSAEPALTELRARRHTVIATHPKGELRPEDLPSVERPVLVLGNEKSGVSAELEAAADHTLRVPMRGFVESLNLSVTAALLLYAATAGRAGDLTPERLAYLYARALYRTVPRVERILSHLPPR